MTRDEWVKDTVDCIKEAGFEMLPQENGIPLVKQPKGLSEKVRLIKLKLPHGGRKTICAEGMYVTPM